MQAVSDLLKLGGKVVCTNFNNAYNKQIMFLYDYTLHVPFYIGGLCTSNENYSILAILPVRFMVVTNIQSEPGAVTDLVFGLDSQISLEKNIFS